MLLRLDAGRALVQDRSPMGELGHSVNMLVGVVQVVVTGMTKTLMPKKAFSGDTEGVD